MTSADIHEPRGQAADRLRLDGRVAVVSGGSKNIGLETAAAFAQAGAKVVITGRKPDQLQAAHAGLLRLVPEADISTVAADISDADGADVIGEFVEQRHGLADILVNNAHLTGDTRDLDPLDIPTSVYQKVFDTNFFGPIRLINRLMKPLRDAERHGSVINVISGAAFSRVPGLPAYSTSKAALWMLTQFLSQEVGPYIRVNAVCPGIVTEDGQPRFAYGRSLLENGGIPLGRLGSPEEVAAAVLFLASDASSYSSGSVLHANGGRPW